MSRKYKNASDVPADVICKRLEELSDAVTKGDKGSHQFTMRIPAEVDRDADIVLDEAARRLKQIPQWRPIEEAPKDGTRILVFRKKETGYENQIIGIDYWNRPGWMKSRLRMPPTHWMPLPSPPEDA